MRKIIFILPALWIVYCVYQISLRPLGGEIFSISHILSLYPCIFLLGVTPCLFVKILYSEKNIKNNYKNHIPYIKYAFFFGLSIACCAALPFLNHKEFVEEFGENYVLLIFLIGSFGILISLFSSYIYIMIKYNFISWILLIATLSVILLFALKVTVSIFSPYSNLAEIHQNLLQILFITYLLILNPITIKKVKNIVIKSNKIIQDKD